MSNTQHYKYIIIGAGPCGLGAGHRLTKENEKSFIILEKESMVGGLAKSFTDPNGFTWDIGGHVLFSHYEYFDKALLEALPASEWLKHQRHASVFLNDQFIDYPFQNNIHQLPEKTAKQCLEDLEKIDNSKTLFENFEQWIIGKFGKTISEIFMLPYNYKVWGHPASMMSSGWVGERVALIDTEKIKNNFISKMPDTNWGPNNKFSFPKKGGTGAIWLGFEKLLPQDSVKKNVTIEQIETTNKRVKLANGEVLTYEFLLNTIPLKTFSTLVEPPNEQLKAASQKLSTNVSHIIGFGFHGKLPEILSEKCWIYFPENNSPFYRVTVLSRYSPDNTPDIDHWSLLCEVTESIFKAVQTENIINDCLVGLKNTLLKNIEFNCVDQWYFQTNPGYPVPSFDRDELMSSIHQILKPMNIYSRGRFGGHKYEVSNMDHSFMQGVEWVEWITNGTIEKTYRV